MLRLRSCVCLICVHLRDPRLTLMLSPERLRAAYLTARDALLAERMPAGHWVGELSTSALSTATAVMALHLVNPFEHRERIDARPRAGSPSTRTPTAAGATRSRASRTSPPRCSAGPRSQLTGAEKDHPAAVEKVEEYLNADGRADAGAAGRGDPPALRQGPHVLGADPDDAAPWRSWCRGRRCRGCRSSWRACRSRGTASPGCRWSATPCRRSSPSASASTTTARTWNPFANVAAAGCTKGRTLRVLRRIQPTSGGYLEATPLTSFVVMALARSAVGGARPSSR